MVAALMASSPARILRPEPWLRETPHVEAGDAVARLADLIQAAPADAALCVFHCYAQFPAAARAAFAKILRSTSRRRPVSHVSSEGECLNVTRIVMADHAALGVAQRSQALGAVVGRSARTRGL